MNAFPPQSCETYVLYYIKYIFIQCCVVCKNVTITHYRTGFTNFYRFFLSYSSKSEYVLFKMNGSFDLVIIKVFLKDLYGCFHFERVKRFTFRGRQATETHQHSTWTKEFMVQHLLRFRFRKSSKLPV